MSPSFTSSMPSFLLTRELTIESSLCRSSRDLLELPLPLPLLLDDDDDDMVIESKRDDIVGAGVGGGGGGGVGADMWGRRFLT